MTDFAPVLLGLDLNAYSVAIALHDAFGVSSDAFGRYPVGITSYSRILRPHVERGIDEVSVGTARLCGFAHALIDAGKEPILIPCADRYAELLVRAQDYLKGEYRFLLPPTDVFRTVSDKAAFAALLDRFGISHPASAVFFKNGDLSPHAFRKVQIPYPAVLKPSNSTAYYRNPFIGIQKVWFPRTAEDAAETAKRIYDAGYGGSLILQERIRPTRAATLTVFCDADAVARRAVLGDILLEERGIGARGNYAAVLTRPLDGVSFALVRMLEHIGYRGMANLDILYNGERPYVLELNPRQGRSSDYTRAAGVNLPACLVHTLLGRTPTTDFSYRAVLWHCVPLAAVRRYATDRTLLEEAEERIREGACFSPFAYAPDLLHNPVRRCYSRLHGIRRSAALRTEESR